MEAGPNPCHEKSWLHAISSPPRYALAVHGSERSVQAIICCIITLERMGAPTRTQ